MKAKNDPKEGRKIKEGREEYRKEVRKKGRTTKDDPKELGRMKEGRKEEEGREGRNIGRKEGRKDHPKE